MKRLALAAIALALTCAAVPALAAETAEPKRVVRVELNALNLNTADGRAVARQRIEAEATRYCTVDAAGPRARAEEAKCKTAVVATIEAQVEAMRLAAATGAAPSPALGR